MSLSYFLSVSISVFLFASFTNASNLPSRLESTPSPLSVPPSHSWIGNDGPWSSFDLRVGSPTQSVRVLISTASNQPWVVLSEGCSSCAPEDCIEKRGGTFNINNSTTWSQNNISGDAIYALPIESNHGVRAAGVYGYDRVSLGDSMPYLEAQVISGITMNDFNTGYFGLNRAPTSSSSNSTPASSFMTNLKAKNLIPSLSYGYTAGNLYREQRSGSLTLGGFDGSLFDSNTLTFSIRSGGKLSVNINSIFVFSQNGNETLSATSFPAAIDSTTPFLSLPVEVCQRFEEAFGIEYDTFTGLYLVNDTLHEQLLEQSANVVLTLTNSAEDVRVGITLPYQAFDLTVDYPIVRTPTRYFPLKRADNDSQIILGRTFLQEAYLITDYERSNFSVHQMNWSHNIPANIQAILPPTTISTQVPIPAPAQARASRSVYIIPIAVASSVGGAILIVLLLACILILRRRRQNKERPYTSLSTTRKLGARFRGKLRQSPKPRPRISRPMASPSPSPSIHGQTEPDSVSVSPVSPDLDHGNNHFQSLANEVHTPDRLQPRPHHLQLSRTQIHELAIPSPRPMPVVGELSGYEVPHGEYGVNERLLQIERAVIRELQRERSEMLIREGKRDPRYSTPAENWM